MVIGVYVLSLWGLCPQTPTRALPLDPLGDFCTQSPGFVPIRNKFLASPLAGEVKGNERRGRAGRNRTEGAREEGREEGRKGPEKCVKPRARKVASPPLLMHRSYIVENPENYFFSTGRHRTCSDSEGVKHPQTSSDILKP